MLRTIQRLGIDSGKFELIVMLALAGLSFAGAPPYIILGGAVLLLLSTLYEHAHLQTRLAKLGATRLVAGGGSRCSRGQPRLCLPLLFRRPHLCLAYRRLR